MNKKIINIRVSKTQLDDQNEVSFIAKSTSLWIWSKSHLIEKCCFGPHISNWIVQFILRCKKIRGQIELYNSIWPLDVKTAFSRFWTTPRAFKTPLFNFAKTLTNQKQRFGPPTVIWKKHDNPNFAFSINKQSQLVGLWHDDAKRIECFLDCLSAWLEGKLQHWSAHFGTNLL